MMNDPRRKPIPESLAPISAAARLSGLTPRQLLAAIADGSVRTETVNGKRLVCLEDLDDLSPEEVSR